MALDQSEQCRPQHGEESRRPRERDGRNFGHTHDQRCENQSPTLTLLPSADCLQKAGRGLPQQLEPDGRESRPKKRRKLVSPQAAPRVCWKISRCVSQDIGTACAGRFPCWAFSWKLREVETERIPLRRFPRVPYTGLGTSASGCE